MELFIHICVVSAFTEAIKAVENADADIFMRQRLRDKDEVPGALWHIFAADDADKIRQLLRKVQVFIIMCGNIYPVCYGIISVYIGHAHLLPN